MEAEGKVGAIVLVVQGIYLMVSLPLYLLFSPNLFWFHLSIPERLQWVGFGLGVLPLPFLAWVNYVLDRHWGISLSLQKNHTLLISGPYQLILHPRYTVHLVYLFTWVLVSANLLPAN